MLETRTIAHHFAYDGPGRPRSKLRYEFRRFGFAANTIEDLLWTDFVAAGLCSAILAAKSGRR